MNPNSKKIRIYILIMLVLSAAAVTTRTVACIKDLGYLYGYFNDKFFISLSGYIASGGVLILLSYPLFAERMKAEPSFSSPLTYIPSGIVSVGLPYLAITIKRSIDKGASDLASNLSTVLVILSLISVAHFFLTAFDPDSDVELRGYFSLATVVFLAFYAAYLYFDTSLPINSTNKVTDQLAYLSASLFFLYESRLSLTREKWTGYVTFGLISAMLTAYSAIPSLIVYAVRGSVISNSIEESAFTLALFIFITMRLILTSLVKERRESDIIAAMGDFAEARSLHINESMKVHKEAFAVQMTIDDLIGEESELVYVDDTDEEVISETQTPECPTDDGEEQLDFFCEGGLEISESDIAALEKEAETRDNEENEETESSEENTRN